MAKEDTPLTVGNVCFGPSDGTQSKSVLRRLEQQKRGADIDKLARRLAERIYIEIGLHSVPIYEKVIAKALQDFRNT